MTTFDRRTPPATRGAALTAAVAGPVFLVLAFLQPPDGPSLGSATVEQIRTYASTQATAIRLGAVAGIAGAVCVLVITAALATLVRSALPWSPLAELGAAAGNLLGFALLLNTVAGAVPTILPGLVGTSLSEVDDATLRGWYAGAGLLHLLGDAQLALVALVVGTFSIAALRTRLVARWLAWAGLVVAAAAIVGTVAVMAGSDPLYPLWFAGLFGWVLWTPTVGVSVGLRGRLTPARSE